MTVVASRSGGVNKVCTREAESMQNVVATKDLLIFALLVPLFFSNAHIKNNNIQSDVSSVTVKVPTLRV